LFGIDRQVYYRSIKSRIRSQLLAKEVVDMVAQVRMRMPRIGTRKLYFLLKDQLLSMGIGRDKLFAIMKANQMRIYPKRNYRVTTNSYHRFHKHADIVTGTSIVRPEQVWVSDITYVGTTRCYNYLALITDAYSKKIVGYDLSNSLSTDGSLRALQMAVKGRMYPHDILVHHSDRGLQYCSNDYQDLLKKSKLLCSMTTSYDPYTNAVAERVNGIIKNEFDLEKYKVDLETLRMVVAETIEIYNTERPHFSCSLLTPSQMHLQNHVSIKTYKTKNRSKELLASV
jgi:putative transposase